MEVLLVVAAALLLGIESTVGAAVTSTVGVVVAPSSSLLADMVARRFITPFLALAVPLSPSDA